MKLTETKLRSIIREELSRLTEMGGGEDFTLYEVPSARGVLDGNDDPKQVGIEIKKMGSPEALRDWATQREKAYVPDRKAKYGGGYFEDRHRGESRYYFIDKSRS